MTSVRLSSDGVVMRASLDRPAASNAIDYDMVLELLDAVGQATRSASRLLILDSAVENYFSVGMDLDEVARTAARSRGGFGTAVQQYAELLRELSAAPFVTVAVVDGLAVGGGVDLLAAADLVVATAASTFSAAQLRKGIFPYTTAAMAIPRIGRSAFMLWALTGQYWSASQANKRGLVDMILSASAIEEWLRIFSERMRSFEAGPLFRGIRGLRKATHEALSAQLDDAATNLAATCEELATGDDACG